MPYLPYSSMLVAGAFAFVALLAAHFVSQVIFEKDLPRTTCYIIGVSIIALVFLVWCLINIGQTALIAYAAFWAVAIGAGGGTILGHALDDKRGDKNKIAILEGQIRAEKAKIADLEQQIVGSHISKRAGHGS